ncbi:MAG TPA: helix-turn-helix domain-containing protein [Acidimicrobiales bacterium]|jgi:AraC-like DNA-binding protein
MTALADALEQALADALARSLPDLLDRLEAANTRAYSVAEVAERLDVSESTVRRLIGAGHLPTVPHLTPQRIAGCALDDFLAGKP